VVCAGQTPGVVIPDWAMEVLVTACQRMRQGLPPSAESEQVINGVGRSAHTWLLAQRRWQCSHCERPATRLSHSMSLGSGGLGNMLGSPVFATNQVPCLPMCDDPTCSHKTQQAQTSSIREQRHHPVSASSLPGISGMEMTDELRHLMQEGGLGAPHGRTNGDGELHRCEHCDKTSYANTSKFKGCARCLRVRYWCVLCPFSR
jgi:hypothetical protein